MSQTTLINDVQSQILAILANDTNTNVPYEFIEHKILKEETNKDKNITSKILSLSVKGLLEKRRVNIKKSNNNNNTNSQKLFLSLTQSSLPESAAAVLERIKLSGSDGIDQPTLIQSLKMNKMEMNKSILLLLKEKQIQEQRSFTNRAKKIYLLAHLTPSSAITGGIFYSYAGDELDVNFVDEMRRRCVAHVSAQQYYKTNNNENNVHHSEKGVSALDLLQFLVEDNTPLIPANHNNNNNHHHLNKSPTSDGSVFELPPVIASPISKLPPSSFHPQNNNNNHHPHPTTLNSPLKNLCDSSLYNNDPHNNNNNNVLPVKSISKRDAVIIVNSLVMDGILEPIFFQNNNNYNNNYQNNNNKNPFLTMEEVEQSSFHHKEEDKDAFSFEEDALLNSHNFQNHNNNNNNNNNNNIHISRYVISPRGANIMRFFTAQPKSTNNNNNNHHNNQNNNIKNENLEDEINEAPFKKIKEEVMEDSHVTPLPVMKSKMTKLENNHHFNPNRITDIEDFIQHCGQQSFWETAPISHNNQNNHNHNHNSEWSLLPAVGFICLGCPLLLKCEVTANQKNNKSIISPSNCPYMAEWLRE